MIARARRWLPAASASALLLALLAGCSAAVSMEPAPAAGDPLCAEIMVRLPNEVSGQERRWTDAQSTGAWGSPASVLFSCGVEPPGPTTLPCQTVNGVDWIIDDQGDNRYLVRTFGRTPAVELYLDNTDVSSADVLDQFSRLVSRLPSDRSCSSPQQG